MKLYILVNGDTCISDPYKRKTDLEREYDIYPGIGDHIIEVDETDPEFTNLLEIAK